VTWEPGPDRIEHLLDAGDLERVTPDPAVVAVGATRSPKRRYQWVEPSPDRPDDLPPTARRLLSLR
jgi:hypothetical protein